MRNNMKKFIEFITFWIKRQQNVDLVQGLLFNFIRTYKSLICQLGNEAVELIERLLNSQDEMRRTLDHLVSYPESLANQAERTCL